MSVVADWLGTLRSTFRIGRVTLDSGALTAARAVALQDKAGTVALTTPSAAVAEGAVTPAGSYPGEQLWSTLLGKLLVWNGAAWASVAPSFAGISAALIAVTDCAALPTLASDLALVNYV